MPCILMVIEFELIMGVGLYRNVRFGENVMFKEAEMNTNINVN